MTMIRKSTRLDALAMRARGTDNIDDEMTIAITRAVRSVVLFAREEQVRIDWTTARLEVRLDEPDATVLVDFEANAQETMAGGIAKLFRLSGGEHRG